MMPFYAQDTTQTPSTMLRHAVASTEFNKEKQQLSKFQEMMVFTQISNATDLSCLGWSIRNTSIGWTIGKQLSLMPDILNHNRQQLDKIRHIQDLSQQLYYRLQEYWDIESGQFVRYLDATKNIDSKRIFYDNINDTINQAITTSFVFSAVQPKWIQNRLAIYKEIVDIFETIPLEDIESIIMNECSPIYSCNDSPDMTYLKREIYCAATEWLCHYPALIPYDEPYVGRTVYGGTYHYDLETEQNGNECNECV